MFQLSPFTPVLVVRYLPKMSRISALTIFSGHPLSWIMHTVDPLKIPDKKDPSARQMVCLVAATVMGSSPGRLPKELQ